MASRSRFISTEEAAKISQPVVLLQDTMEDQRVKSSESSAINDSASESCHSHSKSSSKESCSDDDSIVSTSSSPGIDEIGRICAQHTRESDVQDVLELGFKLETDFSKIFKHDSTWEESSKDTEIDLSVAKKVAYLSNWLSIPSKAVPVVDLTQDDLSEEEMERQKEECWEDIMEIMEADGFLVQNDLKQVQELFFRHSIKTVPSDEVLEKLEKEFLADLPETLPELELDSSDFAEHSSSVDSSDFTEQSSFVGSSDFTEHSASVRVNEAEIDTGSQPGPSKGPVLKDLDSTPKGESGQVVSWPIYSASSISNLPKAMPKECTKTDKFFRPWLSPTRDSSAVTESEFDRDSDSEADSLDSSASLSSPELSSASEKFYPEQSQESETASSRSVTPSPPWLTPQRDWGTSSDQAVPSRIDQAAFCSSPDSSEDTLDSQASSSVTSGPPTLSPISANDPPQPKHTCTWTVTMEEDKSPDPPQQQYSNVCQNDVGDLVENKLLKLNASCSIRKSSAGHRKTSARDLPLLRKSPRMHPRP